MLSGTLAPFGGDGLKIDLTVTLAGTPDTVAARSVTAQNDGEILELMRRTAQEIAVELFHRLERVPVPQAVVPLPERVARRHQGCSPTPGLIAAVVGVAAAAGGVAALFNAQSQLAAVRAGRPDSYAAAKGQAESAKTLSTAGVVLLAVGGAALAGGVAYALITSRGNAALTLSVAPAPGGLALGGSF